MGGEPQQREDLGKAKGDRMEIRPRGIISHAAERLGSTQNLSCFEKSTRDRRKFDKNSGVEIGPRMT